MCAKRYKLEVPSSTQRVRKARKALREMSQVDQIDLMVKAGLMTPEQAEKAKQKLAQSQG
ncbi:MAG: hypothetical protein U0736_08005 [Gemmataceae bacterium]